MAQAAKKLPVPAGMAAIVTQKQEPKTLTFDVGNVLTIEGKKYEVHSDDFQLLSHIGEGAHGMVQKYIHRPSRTVMAVKRVTCITSENELKSIETELKIARNIVDCPYIVEFYGSFCKEGDVWMCMAFMDTSLHKFHRVLRANGHSIPEKYLAKIASSVIKGLKYLHDELKVIHRDVKPANILMDRNGKVQLCDYSVSGFLVKSIASTMYGGYVPYLAPERIKADPAKPYYDVRADVWSVGITMIEIATGKHPFGDEKMTMFDQAMQIVNCDPPKLPDESPFSPEFRDFISTCVQKEVDKRPKYDELMQHPFITNNDDRSDEDMANFVKEKIAKYAADFGLSE